MPSSPLLDTLPSKAKEMDGYYEEYVDPDEELNAATIKEKQEAIKRMLLLSKMAQKYNIDDDQLFDDDEDEIDTTATQAGSVQVYSSHNAQPRHPKLSEMNSSSLVGSYYSEQSSSSQKMLLQQNNTLSSPNLTDSAVRKRGISRRLASTMASRNKLLDSASFDTLSTGSDDMSDTQSHMTSDGVTTSGAMTTHQKDFIQLNTLMAQFMMCGFPVIIFDNFATLVYLNKEAEDLFGVYSFSVLGEHVADLFLEESVYEIHSLIEEYTGRNISSSGSMSSLPKNFSPEESKKRKESLMKIRTLKAKSTVLKTFFSVKCRFTCINKLGAENFVAYMEVVKESAEGKKEMAMRQVYEAITDLSVIPIVSISQVGIIQTFNGACSYTFGYQKKEAIGKNVKMLCNDKDRAKHDYYLSRYQKTGEKRVVDKTQEQLTRLADKIFPKNVAQRISLGEKVIDVFDLCSVLFCDIVGFTKMSNGKRPEEVVSMLHEIFGSFDDVCTAFQLEKIKTIGDCYFLASGIPKYDPEHADKIVKGGLAMIRVIQHFCKKHEPTELHVRIGIHSSGDIIAGVVGRTKQTYDLFGKGVEIAQLIEATGKTNQIHISDTCYSELQSDKLKSLFSENYKQNTELNLEKIGQVVIPEKTWITELQ
ncbi:hypothetical protein C9374_009276 [Naegleria lovaniensis]|uniref:Uncharacterized protein n=1 Tax=Naegleria lovaniensis TaxID=51637 RepID=A0AA88KEZ2_NAELO|nr:uncharacterized protein C9374_009276 [Naegleria lovaniensis]KAG2377365.1 hypothetical protein C9374_009276 [Naegleria lovaniensis]